MPDRRRRIALVTDAIGPYHHGGKEQRYLQLAPRLAAKADVHVYTMKWWQGPRVRRHDGVTYHAISPRIALYAGTRRSIVEAVVFALCCLRLVTARFDVLEADHMPYIPLFTLKLVAVVRRRRLVVTWHECWGPNYWRTYLGLAGRFGWMLESLAMRLPDTIIAASPQTGARLQEMLVSTGTRDRGAERHRHRADSSGATSWESCRRHRGGSAALRTSAWTCCSRRSRSSTGTDAA